MSLMSSLLCSYHVDDHVDDCLLLMMTTKFLPVVIIAIMA
jgi:hypothetical protein